MIRRNIVWLLIIIAGLSACKNEPLSLNVMSFNVRLDTPSDSLNSWKYRKDYASKMICFYDVDILGTQEVLKNQLDDLLGTLPEYSYLGVGRLDGKTEGEYSAVFYKRERFKLLKSSNFWLSETPEKPGSRGWDAACERIVTWGILEDKKSGIQLAVFNTHFDHIGIQARKNSALLLKERINQIASGLPVILTGDFNDTETSEPVRILASDGKLLDARKISPLVYGPDWSFHDFGRLPLSERKLIDHIFVTKDFAVLKYASIAETLDSTFLSDHNPVVAEIMIKSAR